MRNSSTKRWRCKSICNKTRQRAANLSNGAQRVASDNLDALYGLGPALLLNQHTEQAITILEKAREVFSAHGPAPVHAECLAAWAKRGCCRDTWIKLAFAFRPANRSVPALQSSNGCPRSKTLIPFPLSEGGKRVLVRFFRMTAPECG